MWHIYIYSDILFGILSGISSNRLSGIQSDILSNILSASARHTAKGSGQVG